jgi:predicted RNA-binding protein YlqC (UPF0109 family)
MRNTPVTREFFEEELLPVFEDVISLLLDNPDVVNDTNAVSYQFAGESKEIELTVRLKRPDAARIIGREHSTRTSLAWLFGGICRNHGFQLSNLIVIGLYEDGEVATIASNRR